MNKKDFDGVYVVSNIVDTDVVLTNFHDILSGKQPPKEVVLREILKRKPLIGDDGLEVILTTGELVHFSKEGELLIHIANVGPGDKPTADKYGKVLTKLKISEETKKHEN